MRLEPACASISAKCAVSTFDRVEEQLARRDVVVDRDAVRSSSPVTTPTSLMSGTSRRMLGRVAEERGDHRLGDEVLGPAHLDATRAAACRRG